MQKQVGRRIRELRLARGLTQEALAEKASMNVKYLGAIERGEINVTVSTLDRICSALGVTLGDVLADTGSPGKRDREQVLKAVKAIMENADQEKVARLRVFLETVFR
jgi:transcriptional regulator with XRE-family HTH domain